ncbi:hypothetical protein GCM10027422_19740 [Hymenobacter arcticus]
MAQGLAGRKLLRAAHNSFLMKELIQFINRTHFGQYSNKRLLTQAVARLEALAQKHNPQAMYRLGMLYWDGYGVPQDRERAIPLLQAAAEVGILNAVFNLAMAYDNGYGVAQSHYKAFQYYMQAARLGNARAIHAIGSFYCWGQGVDQDYQKARHWYRRSAKLGYADAMCDLGRCHQRGVGGPKSPRWAIYWFQKAVRAGCLRAQAWLGLAYACEPIEDWKQARYWLEQAAENQQSQGMYILGVWAESGWNDQENLADASFWFQQAAALGHERAALQLALLQGETF